MTQNELYELVADFGEPYGTALRRDSYLARGVDFPENWFAIAGLIGEEQAQNLADGKCSPTPQEFQSLMQWQIETALDQANPDITPTLWICHLRDSDDVLLVEGWGNSLHTELKFRLIGRFDDESSAIIAIRQHYFCDCDDADFNKPS